MHGSIVDTTKYVVMIPTIKNGVVIVVRYVVFDSIQQGGVREAGVKIYYLKVFYILKIRVS